MDFYDYQGNVISSGGGGGGETADLGAYANNLDGKIWLCVGDSLTSDANCYRPIICSNYNVTAPLVSGSPYAGGKHVGFVSNATSAYVDSKSYKNIIPSADIATILMGTNDFGMSPMGTIYDDPTTQTAESYTFYGCYKGLIENIFTAYGVIPIVLMTPPHRTLGTGQYQEEPNFEGHKFRDFCDAIIKLGEWYSLPVVDLWSMSGYAIGNNPIRAGYFGDGLHPGPMYWQQAAPRIYYAMNEAMKRNVIV